MKTKVYTEEKVVVKTIESEVWICDRCGKEISNIRKEQLIIGFPHYPNLNQKTKDICNKCEKSFKTWFNEYLFK